jgi:hypothetical protein
VGRGGGAPTTNYTCNAANQLTNAGFTYDPNGNLTNGGTNAYTWDPTNRLSSMGRASHKDDGEGRRVQQTVGVNVTQYLLDTQLGLAVLEKRNICPDKCSTSHRKCVLYWECESPGVGAAADAGEG